MDLGALVRAFATGAPIHAVNFHNTPAHRAAEYDRELAALAERFGPATEDGLAAFLSTGRWPGPKPGVVVALYNGYFGAGSGILVIALLALTAEPVLHRANALKNVILVVSDLLPAVLFAVLGTVVWRAAFPLGLGAVVGGLIGPSVARRLPEALLRVLVGCCGVALAVYLVVRP